MKRILVYLLAFILLVVVSFLSYLKLALPDVGLAEEITIEATPERLERGKYLANHVTVCVDCHSERDWTLFSGPIIEGTIGQGGEIFDQKFGFPGSYTSKNITPFALNSWTDGEILRAIASGVNKDGKALFPIMPYHGIGQMVIEDVYSIIAYIRTLSPIEKTHAESTSDFPMNFIINTIPKKAEFSERPDPSNKLEYGKYLYTAASCFECHTKQEKGKAIEGMELAGGFEFPLVSGGIVRSANITPDKETGIGNWTEEAFIARFKSYVDSSYVGQKVEKGQYNTIMPWTMYGGMTEEDLSAVFAYLKSVKPIKNEVVKFSN